MDNGIDIDWLDIDWTAVLGNYGVVGDKNAMLKSLIEKYVKEEVARVRKESLSKDLELLQDVLAENFHYRIMFGEIKDPDDAVDVHKEFSRYQELEPERIKFVEWLEKRIAESSNRKGDRDDS